jgi:hypothetical protein
MVPSASRWPSIYSSCPENLRHQNRFMLVGIVSTLQARPRSCRTLTSRPATSDEPAKTDGQPYALLAGRP